MKDLGAKFMEYCEHHQSRYANKTVAASQCAEPFFAGAAAMASLFAEGGFKSFEERAKEFAKQFPMTS